MSTGSAPNSRPTSRRPSQIAQGNARPSFGMSSMAVPPIVDLRANAEAPASFYGFVRPPDLLPCPPAAWPQWVAFERSARRRSASSDHHPYAALDCDGKLIWAYPCSGVIGGSSAIDSDDDLYINEAGLPSSGREDAVIGQLPPRTHFGSTAEGLLNKYQGVAAANAYVQNPHKVQVRVMSSLVSSSRPTSLDAACPKHLPRVLPLRPRRCVIIQENLEHLTEIAFTWQPSSLEVCFPPPRQEFHESADMLYTIRQRWHRT